ncbi:GNAT family N-acetyltransferase [Streptomyces sp. NPDC047023]|uniref:GNAT family N-acetyltransferase n=1 Tax=Streptomyces sp. NPDC047023 TaxID=3155139 RepID=UPI0033E9421E
MRDRVEAGPWQTPGPVLRRWAPADASAVLTAFADPLMRGQSAEPVASAEAARRWVEERAAQWEAGTTFAFAVVDGDDRVLGNVSVGPVDRRHSVGWVSYWTTGAARGRGVASRACATLADWAFREAGLFRLELGHRVNNPGSCRVAHAAGFAVEGLQRAKLAHDGVRYDVELHARLATDPEPPRI